MARYVGPKCRLCRREETKLFLKGARCSTVKCALTRRQQLPGIHGGSGGGRGRGRRRRRVSDYGLQLREKQKVKRLYGVLEKQFRRYLGMAQKASSGGAGAALLVTLERRLDNVIYRLGLAPSRASARQLIRYGRIAVNGTKVTAPPFLVSEGDEILAEGALADVEESGLTVPEWLQEAKPGQAWKVVRLPEREDVTEPIDEHLVVEFYSR